MNIKKITKKYTETEWKLGFITTSLDGIINGDSLTTVLVKSDYNKGWFADPFILDVTDSDIILFCEEYYYKINRGRISKLTIDRKSYEIKEIKPMLTLPTHLSFPFIRREGDNIYVLPENYKGGGSILYKYNKEKDSFESLYQISTELLTDAVITDLFGRKLCFSTKMPDSNGSDLQVYSFENNKLSLKGNCQFPSKVARNAGDYFEYNNEVFRPAQDCNRNYGGGVYLQKIKQEDNSSFTFHDVRRIYITEGRFNLGCHTFNHHKGLTVIDVHGYKHPIIAKLIIWFRQLRAKR